MIHSQASGLASLGRNGDTMIMHVSPSEVAGLQALAKSQGTSLTVNPHTGMPEAFSLGGFFSSLLPLAAGIMLGPAGFGVFDSALTTGLAVGAGTALATGNPVSGLMAGLGGAGGYDISGALNNTLSGLGGASTMAAPVANNIGSTVGYVENPITGASELASSSGAPGITTSDLINASNGVGSQGIQLSQDALNAGANTAADSSMLSKATNFGSDFASNLAKQTGSSSPTMALGKSLGLPLVGALYSGGAFTPNTNLGTNPAEAYNPNFRLNLKNQQPGQIPLILNPNNPGGLGQGIQLGNYQTPYVGGPIDSNAGYGYAAGGVAELSGLKDDAGLKNDTGLTGLFRSISAKSGGYLDGPGDGMSDSIHATIDNKQPARLADGEFVIPADVVSHLGNGSSKAGSQRLYSMLDKVRKARTGHTKQGHEINAEKYLPA